VANATLDYTTEAQEKTLEAIKQGQVVIIEAVAAWAKASEKAMPALRDIPALPALDLPRPEDVVKTSFDFYDKVLETQRKFATDLLAAASPVVKVSKPAA
jgi:hypothetical protein